MRKVIRILMVMGLSLAAWSCLACPCMLNEKKAELEAKIEEVSEIYAQSPTEENLAKLSELNQALESVILQIEQS